MRLTRLFLLLMAALLLAPTSTTAQPAPPGAICFPDIPAITNCLDPAFSPYWQSNGGLPVFGYPIGPVERYQPPDAAAPLQAQWTERNRLELHPQNRPEYRVLLGRMGAERLAQLGREPVEPAEAGPQDGCLWFAETGHNVCDQAAGLGFRSYWQSHGLNTPGLDAFQRSLALFGLPLTTARAETGSDGRQYLTQWFERARFEWHPDKPDEFKVLLGLLGSEVRPGAPAAAPVAPGAQARGDRSAFGVEISRGSVGATYERLVELAPAWVRYNGIVWSVVEARRGQPDWSQIQSIEQELAAISSAGAETILIVRSAPGWARQFPDKACGPIRPDALADFATFMGKLVARYSQPPYNVKYWELGNEPDIDPDLVGGTAPYGCLGDDSDPYYGGGAYAAMLAAAAPAIKAADPEAQLVLGGLLLDCDPGAPPAGQRCQPARFLEGVLRGGGGEYLDIVSYHAYMYWFPQNRDWDLEDAKWRHRGGALLGKLDFIRDTMAAYGYNKPIMMNEGGLLCYRSDPGCGPNGFYEAQANYVVRFFARAYAADLTNVIWYTLNAPGWQEGNLLDSNSQPRPAYLVARFITDLLADAQYTGGGVEGAVERHRFRAGDRVYELIWTNDGSTVTQPSPQGLSAIYTIRGERQAASTNLNIGFEPLILEVVP